MVGVTPSGSTRSPEQRVDEARLAGVELAGHDEEEEPGELVARLAEAAEVVGVDVAAEASERGGEALEQLLLPGPEVLLALRQDRRGGPAVSRSRWCLRETALPSRHRNSSVSNAVEVVGAAALVTTRGASEGVEPHPDPSTRAAWRIKDRRRRRR